MGWFADRTFARLGGPAISGCCVKQVSRPAERGDPATKIGRHWTGQGGGDAGAEFTQTEHRSGFD